MRTTSGGCATSGTPTTINSFQQPFTGVYLYQIAQPSATATPPPAAAIATEAGWFNVSIAADIIREAAALTTQITGEVIPSDRPGCLALTMLCRKAQCA